MARDDASPTTTDTRWLDAIEMAAWRYFVETHGDLMTALESDLAPTGLNLGDYQVLVYLSEAPEHSMRMCDLADILQLSPSGLTRRLDGLVRAGSVDRRSSELDRRVMLAVLTPAGRRQLESAAPIHVESVRRRFIDLLTRDELRCLASAFRKIQHGLADG
jgi:DNA-binding MarR family transcriptional regulator